MRNHMVQGGKKRCRETVSLITWIPTGLQIHIPVSHAWLRCKDALDTPSWFPLFCTNQSE